MMRLGLMIMAVAFLFILVGVSNAATVSCIEGCDKTLDYIILDESGMTFTPNPYVTNPENFISESESVLKPVDEADEKVSPIPLPGALGLLIMGLISIFGVAARRLMNKED